MAQDWFTPLLAGGGIAVVSSAIGFALQEVVGIAKRSGERKQKRRDEGRDQARSVLADIQAVRATSLDGQWPNPASHHFVFDRDQVRKVRNGAALITDKEVRESVDNAFNALLGLGPAEGELTDSRPRTERSLVEGAADVAAAFVRGDRLPSKSVDYIKKVNKTVASAWDQAAKEGTVHEL